MSTAMKDDLRRLARSVIADPTANTRTKQLARGVLMLMGELK